MKNDENREWSKEDIVLALIKMRIEKFATTKTMLDFLMNKLGYAQTYAYELLKISKARIEKIFKEGHEESFYNAVARLEEMIEETKSERHRLAVQIEMNKLLGLHKPQRVDITSGGKEMAITEVIVKIVKAEE